MMVRPPRAVDLLAKSALIPKSQSAPAVSADPVASEGPLSCFIAQHAREQCQQPRQLAFDDPPHQPAIHGGVAMDQHVAERDDPGQVGDGGGKLGIDAASIATVVVTWSNSEPRR